MRLRGGGGEEVRRTKTSVFVDHEIDRPQPLLSKLLLAED